jgi:hypothetical protein
MSEVEKNVEFVEVHNKGKKEYIYKRETLVNGKDKIHTIKPGETKPIEKEIASKLISLYPKDLTEKNDVSIVDLSKDALEAEKAVHKETKAELERKTLELRAVKEDNAKIRAENNTLKAAAAANAAEKASQKNGGKKK